MMKLIQLWFLPFLVAGYFIYDDFTLWEQDVYQPLIAQIESEKARLAELERAIKRIQEFEDKKGEKLAEISQLTEQFQEVRKQFPSEAALPDLLRQLADVGEKLGIEFSSFVPEGGGPQDLVQSAKIRVMLKGTYVQIMSFLDATARMTRIVNTETLKLTMGEKRGERVMVTAEVSLLAYYLPGG